MVVRAICCRDHSRPFRSGTAPIAIETGRYAGTNLIDRKCFTCKDPVEDEMLVLLHCPVYSLLRNNLFHEVEQLSNGFKNLSDNEKITFIMINESIIKLGAKTCYLILNKIRSVFYIVNVNIVQS